MGCTAVEPKHKTSKMCFRSVEEYDITALYPTIVLNPNQYFQRFSSFLNYSLWSYPRKIAMTKFDAKNRYFEMAVKSLIFYEKGWGKLL